MRKYIFKLFIFYAFTSLAQKEGPVVPEKLDCPKNVIKQYIQKRSYQWIEGQWIIDGDKYSWTYGHWVPKRLGYHFINGKWIEKENGWAWIEGYWEAISIKKWKTLYS